QDTENVFPKLLNRIFQEPPPPPEVEGRLRLVISRKIDDLEANNDQVKLAYINAVLALRGLQDEFRADEVLESLRAINVSIISPVIGARFEQPCPPGRNFCRFEIQVEYTVVLDEVKYQLDSISWEYKDTNGLHRFSVDAFNIDLVQNKMLIIPKSLLCGLTETIELRITGVVADRNTGTRRSRTVSRNLNFVCRVVVPEEQEEGEGVAQEQEGKSEVQQGVAVVQRPF
ncbi:MAG: hypothetical protein ACT4P5_23425, partial [Armatimonadota bacterium]